MDMNVNILMSCEFRVVLSSKNGEGKPNVDLISKGMVVGNYGTAETGGGREYGERRPRRLVGTKILLCIYFQIYIRHNIALMELQLPGLI